MSSLKNKKVLITCGPTWVPIDDMRVIANRSTGEMGYLLAEAFAKEETKVTLLLGPVEEKALSKNVRKVRFTFL